MNPPERNKPQPPRPGKKENKPVDARDENRDDRPAHTSIDDTGNNESTAWEHPVTNQDEQRRITNTPPAGQTGLTDEQAEGI